MVKRTHSNNSSTDCLSVFDHFVGLVLKGLKTVLCYNYEMMKPSTGIANLRIFSSHVLVMETI